MTERDFERFLHYSRQFFDAHRYSNNGPVNRLLEARLAAFHGTERCVTFSSLPWGMSLTMRCLALLGRSEVVMVSPPDGGRSEGTFGDVTLFSFDTTVGIEGFGGAYITTDDTELADELACLRGFGFRKQDEVIGEGFNAKLNEIHASMTLAALDRVENRKEAEGTSPAMREQREQREQRESGGSLVKASPGDFAVLGGQPAFGTELPVGQLYFPSWQRYESAMRGIFERERYTGDGPLVHELEERLEDFLGVRHVMTVSNATAGLYMVAKTLETPGAVLVPAFTFIATVQALAWAGLEPVFCDVDRQTHHISTATAGEGWERWTAAPPVRAPSAVFGVNLWGGTCDPPALAEWATGRNLDLFFDSAQGFGCAARGTRLGGFGRAEVFSFHATKVLSSTEGGCIATDDDDLAARIRNMRSDAVASPAPARPAPATLIADVGMSEAEAAVALMSLEDFEEHREHNRMLGALYREHLVDLPGLTVVDPPAATGSNHQYLVCEIDEEAFGLSRDSVLAVLEAEGVRARRYFFPGAHRTVPYRERYPQYAEALPVTDALCHCVLQLPVGALVSPESAEQVSELVWSIQRHAGALRHASAGPRSFTPR